MTPELAIPGIRVVVSEVHGGRLVGARGVIVRAGEPRLHHLPQRRDEPIPEPVLVCELWVALPGVKLPDGRAQHDIPICCRDVELET